MKRTLPLILAIFVLSFASSSYAARMASEPLLEALGDGYGVVAVTVLSATPSTSKYAFDVACKVEQLIAQPVAGEKLTCNQGEVIHISLSSGYGAVVEFHDIVQGDKYILTLKYDPKTKAFTQIVGASSVRIVKDFDANTLHAIHAIHDLAAATLPDRFALARTALTDPQANLELRWSARSVLVGVAKPNVPQQERDKTIALMREQWAHITLMQGLPVIAEGYLDIQGIDRTLTTLDPDFKPDSDVRINGWLNVIFTPFDSSGINDPLGKTTNDRYNLYLHSALPRLGSTSPDKVAPRIIQEMNSPKWPNEFRVGTAGALQIMYQQAEQPNAMWERELQRFYPAAFGFADPWSLRLLADFISYGQAEPQGDSRRKFIAQKETWDAIEPSISRMQTKKADPNAAAAIADLRRLLPGHG